MSTRLSIINTSARTGILKPSIRTNQNPLGHYFDSDSQESFQDSQRLQCSEEPAILQSVFQSLKFEPYRFRFGNSVPLASIRMCKPFVTTIINLFRRSGRTWCGN